MFGMDYKLVGAALSYAVTHHRGQFRKDGITEYIVHPLGVAEMVYNAGGSEEMIIAALFHDILEDCECTEEEMREKWGDDVTDLVVALTNTSKQDRPELNRAQRKALDAERLATQPIEVHLIKLCDILYNVNDLESFTRGFAIKFLKEKREQVKVMTADWADGDHGHVVVPTQAYWDLRRKCLDTIKARLASFDNG